MEEIPGTFLIDGIRVGHTRHEVEVIAATIKKFEPKWFVEIGLHEGGLAYILTQRFPKMDYLGVEINCSIVRREVKDLLFGAQFRFLLCGDCFEPALIETVKWFTEHGNGIVYCDGGDKPKELETYAPILKPGDVIMVHDFYYSERPWPRDVPDEYRPEVGLWDVNFLINNKHERLSEDEFEETRIIGFKRK